MFIIVLRLTDKKSAASALMPGHDAWIRSGFDDGAFVLMGGLKSEGGTSSVGGVLLARGPSRQVVEERVAADPLVAEGIAVAEVLEVEVKRITPTLELLGDTP